MSSQSRDFPASLQTAVPGCPHPAHSNTRRVSIRLQSVDDSISRVAERVRHGGHDVPLETLKRRYPRSARNLLSEYANVCTEVLCVDNTRKPSVEIFHQIHGKRAIINQELYTKLEALVLP